MTALILIGSFVIMLFCNVPIAVGLGLSSVFALLSKGLSLDMVPINYYAATGKFVLLSIPFFILAGNIMEKTGISKRLINFAQSLVGHIRGGVGIVCVIVACFFAAISGSGPATVAALGMLMIPAMIDVGYPRNTSSALMATAGSIGVIIPPSITFVIYGSIAGVSITKLFMAGIIPGLLMGLFLIIAIQFTTRKMELVKLPKQSAKGKVGAFKDAFWALLMPIIILGGIYGGVFTPTEAAAVAAVYGLVVGVFIYRSITMKDLAELLVNSVKQTASVMFITAAASLFAWLITTEGYAAAASSFLINLANGQKIVFLLIINIVLLIAGCFLDGTSAFYIFTPIFLPVALQLGYDPIALGVLMVMNLAIGMVTPPVGVCLYVSCGIGKVSIKDMTRGMIPFLIASIAALLMITYLPQISMLLPNLLS